MGEARDRDGNVLGEAEGETKRDVFEKLSHAHPDAHELRIRSQEQSATAVAERPRVEVPSVGRIVHYVAYGTPGGEFPAGVCRAAIITEINGEDRVSLCAFNPTGLYFNHDLPYADDHTPGTWHWPERL